VSLPLDAEAGRVGVRLQTVRDVDMILPRARAAVRHRASELPPTAEPESTWDFVFDLGTLIRRRGDADADETRLREALEKNPDDAAAAARLGGLLLKKQDYTAAGRWLRAAYNGRAALPDDGRRVRMQLRELARRLAALGGRHVGGPPGRIGEEPPPRSPPG
jgi:lipopolysaccharide biosynthesis regulator YciM